MEIATLNFFWDIWVDLEKLATNFDDEAQKIRFQQAGRRIQKDTPKDKHLRLISVASRILGVVALLQAFLMINPMVDHRDRNAASVLFRLAAAGICTIIGHDSIIVGKAIRENFDLLIQHPSFSVSNVSKIFRMGASNLFESFKTRNQPKQDPFLKDTWVLKDLIRMMSN